MKRRRVIRLVTGLYLVLGAGCGAQWADRGGVYPLQQYNVPVQTYQPRQRVSCSTSQAGGVTYTRCSDGTSCTTRTVGGQTYTDCR